MEHPSILPRFNSQSDRSANEIGIRLALGASRADTVWMVLREALVLAAAGVLIGMPFVRLLGRASQALLYGVSAFDPLAVSASAAGLLAFAAAAGWIPARRASRLEPLAASTRRLSGCLRS